MTAISLYVELKARSRERRGRRALPCGSPRSGSRRARDDRLVCRRFDKNTFAVFDAFNDEDEPEAHLRRTGRCSFDGPRQRAARRERHRFERPRCLPTNCQFRADMTAFGLSHVALLAEAAAVGPKPVKGLVGPLNGGKPSNTDTDGAMIDFYYWPTPNGHKITLFLEEAGLDYTIRPVNISAGDQLDPKFLAFSPNNRMPAIIDHDPVDHGEPVSVFNWARSSLPR